MKKNFYPYEVMFQRSSGWGCMPCKTLREAKRKAADYSNGDKWVITKRETEYEQIGRTILSNPGTV